MNLSSRVSRIAGQPMFDIMTKAKLREAQGEKMYHFEIGDLVFDTPSSVKAAAIAAVHANNTHYAPSRGSPALVAAATEDAAYRCRCIATEKEILVTPGANIQIYLALAAACDAGDSVIIPTPYFPSYVSQCQALEIIPLRLYTPAPKFKITATDVDGAHRSGVKGIILNSPNNPTGAVYSEDELKAIYSACKKHDMFIISDEVYATTVFDYCSIKKFDTDGRVLVVNSFSKSLAMSGWRIGYAFGPADWVEKMRVLQETILSCVSPFIQSAGIAALNAKRDVLRYSEGINTQLYTLYTRLRSIDTLRVYQPEGGLYCWAQILNGKTSAEYCADALDKGVVLCPGTVFGVEGFVRFSCCSSLDDIIEGVRRLK